MPGSDIYNHQAMTIIDKFFFPNIVQKVLYYFNLKSCSYLFILGLFF
jgi:hypothetical protein